MYGNTEDAHGVLFSRASEKLDINFDVDSQEDAESCDTLNMYPSYVIK